MFANLTVHRPHYLTMWTPSKNRSLAPFTSSEGCRGRFRPRTGWEVFPSAPETASGPARSRPKPTRCAPGYGLDGCFRPDSTSKAHASRFQTRQSSLFTWVRGLHKNIE